MGVDEGAYPTPNVTLHKSYTTTESACGEDEYLKLRIETDADNAVKRISYDVPYEEYQVEYDIVVGNEVIDEAMNHPEFPEEEKLYKYEIKNRTKTKNTRHRKPGNDRDHLPIVPEKFSKETIKR